MNRERAMSYGLGYASAREDASGVATAAPGTDVGFIAFARAYAAGWDEYMNAERGWMPNARTAYDTWQRTHGATIFAELTEADDTSDPAYVPAG